MQDKIIKIADHFGIEMQYIKTTEELGELTQAIAKAQLEGLITNNRLGGLIEEIADVEIMIAQIKYLISSKLKLDIESLIKTTKEAKLDRTIERYIDNKLENQISFRSESNV